MCSFLFFLDRIDLTGKMSEYPELPEDTPELSGNDSDELSDDMYINDDNNNDITPGNDGPETTGIDGENGDYITETKQMETLYICILCDATKSFHKVSSMEQINKDINDIWKQAKSLGNFDEIYMGFVAYRDHDCNERRIEMLPFTKNIDTFKKFVAKVKQGI